MEKEPEDSYEHQFYRRWWPTGENEVKPPLYEEEEVIREPKGQCNDEKISGKCKVMRGTDLIGKECILYREEYEKMEQAIESGYRGLGGLAVLCGHPGTGKSICLYTILASRLRQKKVTIFETHLKVLIYTCDGVYKIPKTMDNDRDLMPFITDDTWVLLDGHPQFDSPCDILVSPKIFGSLFFVLASSPCQYHWENWLSKPEPIVMYFMKPWSWEEIVQARSMQKSSTPSEQELRRFFVNFGPSARDVYFASLFPIIYKARIEDIISSLDHDKLIKVLAETRSLNASKVSYKIMVIKPDPRLGQESFTVSFITPHVAALLIRNSKLNVGQLVHVYQYLLSDKVTFPAAGMILKAMIHRLAELGGGQYLMKNMKCTVCNDNAIYRAVAGSARGRSELSFYPRTSQIFSSIEELLSDGDSRLTDNLYYIPEYSDHPNFDAVTVEHKNSGTLLTFYQITVSDEYRLLDSVLETIDRLLMTWKPVPKWRIVFIVPSSVVTQVRAEKRWQELDVRLLHIRPEEAARQNVRRIQASSGMSLGRHMRLLLGRCHCQ